MGLVITITASDGVTIVVVIVFLFNLFRFLQSRAPLHLAPIDQLPFPHDASPADGNARVYLEFFIIICVRWYLHGRQGQEENDDPQQKSKRSAGCGPHGRS